MAWLPATSVTVEPARRDMLRWASGGIKPASPATAPRYVPENNTLYVSTFGRGVWSLALSGVGTALPEAGLPALLPAGGAVVIATLVGLRKRRRRRQA
jgi:hypothetical protein